MQLEYITCSHAIMLYVICYSIVYIQKNNLFLPNQPTTNILSSTLNNHSPNPFNPNT